MAFLDTKHLLNFHKGVNICPGTFWLERHLSLLQRSNMVCQYTQYSLGFDGNVEISPGTCITSKAPTIIISIHHKCEDVIEKSVLRITDWPHKACRMMTNGDPDGQIIIYHPHANNSFFFFITTSFYIGKKHEKDCQKIHSLLIRDMVTSF